MQVSRYLFESPYSSPVQFGRPDPTAQNTARESGEFLQTTNQKAQEAQQFATSEKKEVKPTVSANKLDLYA